MASASSRPENQSEDLHANGCPKYCKCPGCEKCSITGKTERRYGKFCSQFRCQADGKKYKHGELEGKLVRCTPCKMYADAQNVLPEEHPLALTDVQGLVLPLIVPSVTMGGYLTVVNQSSEWEGALWAETQVP